MFRNHKLWLFPGLCGLILFLALPVRGERLADTVYVAGNPSLYPLEYYQNGAYRGEFPSLLEEIGEEIGLNFVYLPPVKGVSQFQRAVNRQVELVSCLVRTGQWDGEDKLTMTDPLYSIPLDDGTAGEVCFGITELMPETQAQLLLDALSRRGISPRQLTAEELEKPHTVQWALLAAPALAAMVPLCRRRRKPRNPLRVVNEQELCAKLDGLEAVSRPLWYLAVLQLEEAATQETLQLWLKEGSIPALLDGKEAALLFTTPSDAYAGVIARTMAEKLQAKGAALLPLREYEMASMSLLSSARQVCRLAQQQETGLIVCTGQVGKSLSQRDMLLRQLRSALEKGEFELYIQPIVRVSDGRPIGGEALSRWDHPTLGFLTPGRFLGLIQELGLETELDHYQLRRVCRELVTWREAGRGELHLHCNVSRKTLSDAAFSGWLDALLERTGLPAQALTIEVTEEADGPEGRQALLENLWQLKRRGIRLALDDYGTGATCPEDLRLGLYDTVKLDVSILRGADSTEGMRAMEEILAQVHAGGAIAVCEGVETAQQAALVQRLGCEQIQGYYYYRPYPQRFARKLLLERREHEEPRKA